MGCQSQEGIKDTQDDTKPTVSQDKSQNIKLPTLFDVNPSKKIELAYRNYYIYEPECVGFNYYTAGLSCFNFENKNKKSIGVQILSIELSSLEKDQYKTIEDISSDNSYISMGRDGYLDKIEKGFFKLNYEGKPQSTDLNGREAILNKGIASEVTYKDKLNYAMFDFFLDDEKTYPCEVILTSSDGVSADDLEAMARELINTIQSE